MWIAFKLYFYSVLWQRKRNFKTQNKCCELLSNCIFTRFFDNRQSNRGRKPVVVNCFQIVFLLGSLTTLSFTILWPTALWIAFKLYFYSVLWQQSFPSSSLKASCELLSNCIFTRFFDNLVPYHSGKHYVVNCFQIVFLLGSLTTLNLRWLLPDRLWIAFKLYFYSVLWQPAFWIKVPIARCELLSNCIFTRFFDNLANDVVVIPLVVNCFQIVFLLGSLTTSFWNCNPWDMLWIAFKLYFYSVLWQLPTW